MNLKLIYKKFKTLIYNINNDNINEYSAQCSYYTILSFIPFVILLLTLIQYTGIKPQTLFDAISKVVPSSMNEIILNIVQEVYSKSLGTISISIVFTIWSAGKGLYALTKGIQKIYKTDSDEKISYIYLRIKSVFETIIFIFLIVLGLVILVFGSTVISFIQNQFILTTLVSELFFILITFFVFLLLYKFMPKHNVTFKSQIYGSIFGAISLNIISFIFSKYLYIFKGFSITYGSLTTLMLIMMWTYSCFYIIFLGAELNKLKITN